MRRTAALAVASLLLPGALLAAPDDPAAKIGTATITEGQLVQALLRRYGYVTLSTMMAREAIAQAAAQAGLTVTDAEVEARIKEFADWKDRHAILTGETYAMYLVGQGLTKELYAEAMHYDLLLEKMVAPQVQVTDQTVAQYYTGHAQEFVVDEAMRASYIRMANLDQATKVHDQITAGQLTFDAAVTQYSEDDLTKGVGGKYDGWVRRMDNPFSMALFGLQMDADISPVVDMRPLGYYIIRRDRYVRNYTLPYEEVRDDLRKQLTDEQTANLKDAQRRQILAAVKAQVLYQFPAGAFAPNTGGAAAGGGGAAPAAPGP